MSYLNHDQIEHLITKGEMLHTDPGCVNAASLDVRLGDTILVERYPGDKAYQPINYGLREKLHMDQVRIGNDGFILWPGQVMLAHTIEQCNFADDTAALFRIKSSMGRIFLEHMDAGWVDPGFHGSLTLEFKNMSQYHPIHLHVGDKIGQLVFFKGDAVNEQQSYRTKGNYGGSVGVEQVGYKEQQT